MKKYEEEFKKESVKLAKEKGVSKAAIRLQIKIKSAPQRGEK